MLVCGKRTYYRIYAHFFPHKMFDQEIAITRKRVIANTLIGVTLAEEHG